VKVRDALILMAGRGSRLQEARGFVPKPLLPIGGRPLISYAIDSFAEAGVEQLHVVVGPNGDALADELQHLVEPRMKLNPIANPDWQKRNGISVLKAAGQVAAPFFLAMGDHLFDASILNNLVRDGDSGLLNLAIDRKVTSIFDLDDAMKVQTRGDRVLRIGKTLSEYDAIDTGLFLCPDSLFDYLRRARREEDCSLADGVQLMATAGKVRAVDIGAAWWQDVDTPEMLARAMEELSANEPATAALSRPARG
jgi:choline kinase